MMGIDLKDSSEVFFILHRSGFVLLVGWSFNIDHADTGASSSEGEIPYWMEALLVVERRKKRKSNTLTFKKGNDES